MCVCVHACMCVHMHACIFETEMDRERNCEEWNRGMCVCVRACVCACMHAFLRQRWIERGTVRSGIGECADFFQL